MQQDGINQDPKQSRTSTEHLEDLKGMKLVEHRAKAEAFVGQDDLPPLDRAIEKRLNRKLDIWVMPLLTLNFVFAFVDRANLGNAKILGLEKDLGMEGFDFNWATTAFYFSYIASELPSNMLLKRFGAKFYLPFLFFCFGTVTLGTAFVKNFGSLVATRLLLGMAEGGLLPGYSYYLSNLYPRYELVSRIAGMVSASLSSGFIGGFLAFGLGKVGPHGPLHTWRWIFFAEGIISIGLAVLSYIVFSDGIESAWYLSEDEKALGVERLKRQELSDPSPRITRKHVMGAVKNINNWLAALTYATLNVPTQSCILFLPTLINAMGYQAATAQLMSGAPFLVGTIMLVFQGWLSDKLRRRGMVLVMFAPFMALCFTLLLIFTLASPSLYRITGLRYMAIFLGVSFGTLGASFSLAWAMNNSPNSGVRAVSSALVVGVGALGSFIASWTYTNVQAPKYITGHSINLAFSCAGICFSALYWWYCSWENHQRDLGKRDHRLADLTQEEIAELGHRHPDFRYAS